MKKRIIISIVLGLLMAIMAVLPAFAASATANVSSTTAGRGATVTVTVSLAQGVTVGSGGISLTYDSSVLELVSAEWNVKNTMLATFDKASNKGAFAYTSGTQISGTVFTAKFKVKSNAAFAASTVKMDIQLKDGSNNDISVTNNSGKVTVQCKHSYSGWTSANGTSHTRTCSICNHKDTANHAFTNACDTKCDTCGYTRTIKHSYKTTWSSDVTNHWHECSVCKDKKDTAKHTPGAAATETTAQTCITCGYVIQKALGHTHKPTGDWLTDANSHWKNCSTCKDKAELANHTYNDDCDKDCNVCGYERKVTHKYASEWSSDESGHWHACTGCSAKDEVVAHVPGAEATEETPQLCTVCNYEIAPQKAHEHNYEGDWKTDANGHWKDCRCGEGSDTVAHSWDAGEVIKQPTESEAGEKKYTCSECGYVKSVELELIVDQLNKDEDDSTSDVDHDVGSENNNVVAVVIASTVSAIVGAGVSIVMMLFLRKQKR